MDGISRKTFNETCKVLRASGNVKLADEIEKYDIIPKLYAYTYLKRVHQELDSHSKEEDFEEFETKIDLLEGLDMDYINKNNFKAIKNMLGIAFDRENYICDFDDTRNPSNKTGICENESHYEDDPEVEKEVEKLSLVLMPDEDNKKFDDRTAEYWCQNCCEQAEPDVEVMCDMDIEA